MSEGLPGPSISPPHDHKRGVPKVYAETYRTEAARALPRQTSAAEGAIRRWGAVTVHGNCKPMVLEPA